MTIAQVEILSVHHEVSPARSVSIAPIPAHDFVYCRITDRDGITGWGETYVAPGIAAILGELAEILVGRDAQDARSIWADLAGAAEHSWAVSAMSIGIDDLRGRQLGIPVHGLYGGALRSTVRAYAASVGYVVGEDPADTWPAELADHASRGFTATKLRIGRDPIAHEVRVLRDLVAAHPDTLLLADGNGAYDIAGSIRMGRALDELGFHWLEEPMPQRGGYAAYEQVAAALDIALAGGEITASRYAALETIGRGCFDIIQPEPVIVGGIGEAIWIAELARVHGIACVPHTSGGIVGLAAALHVLATIPDASTAPATTTPMLEVGSEVNPWRTDLATNDPLAMEHGFVRIPTGPGLGIEIDEDFLRAHTVSHRVVRA